MIKLYNTLSKEKEELKPIKEGAVSMYHCGPTAYNYAHIGNLRAYVFADILRRACEYNNLSVKQVINITDVGHLTDDANDGEDKVEKKAQKENISAKKIVERYTDAFFADLDNLNIETQDTLFPKASQHIQEQIQLIQILENKGFTYKTSDGIYFDTSKKSDYGKLGNIDLSDLQEGARVKKNSEKKNPTDFVLWKFSPKESKRQQEWDSPWGLGFPGWHIECSAMSEKYLGKTFDIHTGGIDHIPVHHNNEIAQSECANEQPLANIWMHNAFIVTATGEKMAKSEGNFLTLEALRQKGIHPLSYRYWILNAHYRSPITYSEDILRNAQNAYEKLLSGLLRTASTGPSLDKKQKEEEFRRAINNDLNTSLALSVLYEVLDSDLSIQEKQEMIFDFDKVLGLNLEETLKELTNIPEEIQRLHQSRIELRQQKEYDKSDTLRKTLEEQGYAIFDYSETSTIQKTLNSLL